MCEECGPSGVLLVIEIDAWVTYHITSVACYFLIHSENLHSSPSREVYSISVLVCTLLSVITKQNITLVSKTIVQ